MAGWGLGTLRWFVCVCLTCEMDLDLGYIIVVHLLLTWFGLVCLYVYCSSAV